MESESTAPPPSLAPPPSPPPNRRPTLPASFFKFPVRPRLRAIQQYISSFEYKLGAQTSYNCHKARPFARIMDTAKAIIYNPQPIKCVEAVFLALYLTAGITDVERIPLSFKSESSGQVHQHIVLLVRYNNRYGAFGISRQRDLMNKDFEFERVSHIVGNYIEAYEQSHHRVLRIRLGLPVEHNIESFNFVCWRYLSLDPSSSSWEKCSEALERHTVQAKKLWNRWLLDGQRENKTADKFPKNNESKSTIDVNPGSITKAIKRRQEPDKQIDLKFVKRRPGLAENRNASNQPSIRKIVSKTSSKLPATCVNVYQKERSFCGRKHVTEENSNSGQVSVSRKDQKKTLVKIQSFELFSPAVHKNEKIQKLKPYQTRKNENSKRESRKEETLVMPLEITSCNPAKKVVNGIKDEACLILN